MVIFRLIKGICGFFREIVIVVIINIESIEFCRRENGIYGFEEYLRVGIIDDVEVFFVLLYRFLGFIFILKEFKVFWRKLVR